VLKYIFVIQDKGARLQRVRREDGGDDGAKTPKKARKKKRKRQQEKAMRAFSGCGVSSERMEVTMGRAPMEK
jgi:hypothetical protein